MDADRVRILADIRATMGSDSLNTHIKKAIVEVSEEQLREGVYGAPQHQPPHGCIT